MSTRVEQVSAVLDEALNEAVGRSRKKWALVVVAFVAGVVATVLLIRRAQSGPEIDPVDAEIV